MREIKKADNIPREEGHRDQIILNNGHVLSGEIVSERAKSMYEIMRRNYANIRQVAFRKQIAAVYKNGVKVDLADK